ncbi:response regulator [Caulobacter sp. 17J80-11]|uniref:response regulator n=1 Tax=Caulobacter sp. 17J80-11 TaxID=2763502 RepID=UPI0016536C3E|nr:response regulator [Caulobacter sp. 17J80-11]MBC6981390.1 response regulator [Caulobacter sp. 17J80-11]
MTTSRPLRVLVVEDEMMVALLIEDMLADLGHQAVGPALRLDEALELARTESFDAAMLDVNLGEAKSFAVADILRQRKVPFFFATGYGVQGLSEAYRGAQTLEKPFGPADLQRALAAAAA